MANYPREVLSDPTIFDHDDGYYDDGCCHEDAEYDVIEGTATCNRCGERWHVSSDEWKRLEQAQREYDEWEAGFDHEAYQRCMTGDPSKTEKLGPDDIPF